MTITIDIEKLRKDLMDDCYGAFFGGGFGGALIEASDIEDASAEELIKIAERNGIDLREYAV
ncbi:MAG: hypothetical protein II086_01055 [Ruminococcus sp.]|jgi:hypothetical protein|nr:hypothetical protein [Ruminococcus sp.]